MFGFSERLKKMPAYLFAKIDRQKKQLRERGISLIDLSVGDPDIPAPKKVIDVLYAAAGKKENQNYALDVGKANFRGAIEQWMKNRFNVLLNRDEEILPLIGSKEGLVHFPLGFVNKGNYIIIPDPAYPAYRSAAILSSAKIYKMPLKKDNHFLPNLKKIPFFTPIIGTGKYKLSPVNINDVVFVIESCLNEKIKKKEYDLPGGEEIYFIDLIKVLKKEINENKKNIFLPIFLCKGIALVCPRILSKENIKNLTEDSLAEISLAKNDLNYNPIKFSEGIKNGLI